MLALIGPEQVFLSPDNRAYLKVYYGGEGTIRANDVLKKFILALRAWAESRGFQAKVDSAKGTIGVGDTYGVLGRLPVCPGWTRSTLQAFLSTPEVSLAWLQEKTRELQAATPKTDKKDRPKRAVAPGSVSGLPITAEETELVPDMVRHFRARAEEILPKVREKVSGRGRLVVEDFQIALVVINITALHPNPDRQNPTARIKAIWRSLYDHGLVSRSFCCHRWKVIRNTLADLEVIVGIDSRYSFRPGRKDGMAMKWDLAPVYVLPFQTLRQAPSCALPVKNKQERGEEREIYIGTACFSLPITWRPRFVPHVEYAELARQAVRLLVKRGTPAPCEPTFSPDSG